MTNEYQQSSNGTAEAGTTEGNLQYETLALSESAAARTISPLQISPRSDDLEPNVWFQCVLIWKWTSQTYSSRALRHHSEAASERDRRFNPDRGAAMEARREMAHPAFDQRGNRRTQCALRAK